jgi:hypothetical protein
LPPFHPSTGRFDPKHSLGPEDVDNLYRWGFNAVRLGVEWVGWEPNRGQMDKQYALVMKGIVDSLAKKGIRWLFVFFRRLCFFRFFFFVFSVSFSFNFLIVKEFIQLLIFIKMLAIESFVARLVLVLFDLFLQNLKPVFSFCFINKRVFQIGQSNVTHRLSILLFFV